MSEELKKRNRGSNWMNPDNGVDITPTDKQRILEDAMSRSSLFNPKIGRPYKYEPAEVEERIRAYFLDCVDKARRPTLTGMAIALDVSYDTFIDWQRDTSKPFHNTLQRARLLIQDYEEQMTLEGKTNQIYAIFRDKSRWGFREASEVVLTPNNPLGDLIDEEQLRRRYLDSIPELED